MRHENSTIFGQVVAFLLPSQMYKLFNYIADNMVLTNTNLNKVHLLPHLFLYQFKIRAKHGMWSATRPSIKRSKAVSSRSTVITETKNKEYEQLARGLQQPSVRKLSEALQYRQPDEHESLAESLGRLTRAKMQRYLSGNKHLEIGDALILS